MRAATATNRRFMRPMLEPAGPHSVQIRRGPTKLDWAVVGLCLVFILISAGAAYLEPDIRLLHFLGWLIYLAVIVLALRHSKWGYGIGIATAAFWVGLSLFGTRFVGDGLENWAGFLRTGCITSAMSLLAVPAAISQLLLIVCCIWAYWRIRSKRWSDLAILAGSAAISIGYLAGVVALFWPQFQFR
jgi:hypothetical protein